MLIKIIYKDVIHRQQVDETNLTYDQLLDIIKKQVIGVPEKFLIQYTDEELEAVTIGSTNELSDAFEVAEKDGRSALRLFIVPNAPTGPLSVATNISEQSAVMISERVQSEGSDFGDSDFEFVDEDGEVVTRDSKNANVSAALVENRFQNPSASFLEEPDDVEQVEAETVLTTEQVAVETVPTLPIPDESVTAFIETVNEPIVETVNEPIVETVNEPIVETVNEPIVEKDSGIPDQRVNEIAEEIFREVAEDQMMKLRKALAIVFESSAAAEENMLPLRGTISIVFSKIENVQKVQETLSLPVIARLISDVAVADQNGGNLWDSVSTYMVELLQILSNLLKECPELFTLIPPFVATVMPLMENNKSSEPSAAAATKSAPARVETDDMTIIHKRVQCNGCLEKDPNLTSYITGPRFKSAVVEDFDLCKACEEQGKFRDSHGPFLKIYNPKQTPEAILCILKDSAQGHSAQKVALQKALDEVKPEKRNVFKDVPVTMNEPVCCGDFTPVMNYRRPRDEEIIENQDQSFAEYVNSIVNAKSDDEKAATACTLTPPKIVTSLGCPGNHLLQRFVVPHSGFVCDKCGNRPGNFAIMYGCRTCDFDICQACFDGKEAAAATPEAVKQIASGVIAKAVNGSGSQQFTAHIPVRPQAKFVTDVSLPDGAVVTPGASLTKTWRLKNTGKVTWPAGTRIVHVGGCALGVPSSGVVVEEVAPGHIVDVTIPIVAPARPGRVVGYFRLMTPDAQRFGHRIWIDLNVDGSIGQQIAATVAQPFFDIGQQIVSRVQEETLRLYPSLSSNSAPSNEAISAAAVSAATAAVPDAAAIHDELLKKYEIEVQTLCEMGFMDIERNLQYLNLHNGDLEAVITSLMSN